MLASIKSIFIVILFIVRSRSLAVDIFNNHHSLLSQSLYDPVGVAYVLYGERVVTRQVIASVESASPSVPKQREVLLAAFNEIVSTAYNSLQKFASVLCKFTGNAKLGKAILNDYGNFI